jgi:hypothetical protein
MLGDEVPRSSAQHVHKATGLAIACVTALLLVPSTAHAIRPDLDGERGFELQLNLGVAGYSNTFQRLIAKADTTGPSFTGTRILAPGVYFRGTLGYRIIPILSVGASFAVQQLGAGVTENTPVTYLADANAMFAGVYARLYFISFFPGVSQTNRVDFAGPADPRRFDPWVSLGVEVFQQFVHTQRPPGADPNLFDRTSRNSIGIPLGLGADYRVLPMLAVGLNTQLTTAIGAWTTRMGSRVESGVIAPFNEMYTSLDPVNLHWSVSLSARYTLTL